MSHCKQYAALLDGFVDGALSLQELEQVQAHLNSCRACRAYVEDAFSIRAAFPDPEDTLVPEGFAQTVLDRVAHTPQVHAAGPVPNRRKSRRIWGSIAAAACVVFVLQVALHTGSLQAHSGTIAAQTAGDSAFFAGDANLPETAGSGDGAEARSRSVQEEGAAYKASSRDVPVSEPVPEADAAGVPAALEAPEAAAPIQNGTAITDSGVSPEPAASEAVQPCLTDTFQLPLEQSLRVELPAEQGDLLMAYTPLTDEEGRTCYLLERESYDSLLLALAERNAPQPAVLYTPAAMFSAEAAEMSSVLVYLEEE